MAAKGFTRCNPESTVPSTRPKVDTTPMLAGGTERTEAKTRIKVAKLVAATARVIWLLFMAEEN